MEKKARSKHVGFSAQREQCRLNKYTYTEKINGLPVLLCNYPFPQPEHKKGVCRANTCTDMREIPDDIVDADNTESSLSGVVPMTLVVEDGKVPNCDELDQKTLADSGEGQTEPLKPVCSNE